ncbi:MAG: folylpolyglutamate synthase/dihydrofolate synthase family protein [Prevotella sp.]|nr:folylpolyglutamate synthase/dihydrofolate synthase family protein [Prevotella sp.]
MTYEETIDYLFHATSVFENVGASAYKEGLTNTLALDEHFNHPHRQYKTIHVAGTNGKGSCSHTLASILQAEGYKVGLYTSPHLIDFRERIRVNGKCIDQERVIRFVEEERSFFEPLHPSFFELTTALAFTYFAEQKVDVAVIEVGLGGRLDCTNIITPILSIITNISLDHTQFLGNTLPLIAKEKAGIIKDRIPVVIGETTEETKIVFEEVAKQHDAPLIFAEDNNEIIASKYDNALQERVYKTQSFGEIHGDLMGNYQDKNANTVLNAVKVLKNYDLIKLSDNSVRQGFKQVSTTTGLLGRWQCIQKSPATYCDTGHNAGGWTYLSQQLTQQNCEQMRIVFGMVNDKDLSTIIQMLPQNAHYYWTQPSCQRAFPVEKVAQLGRENHLHGKAFPTVSDAYQAAMHDASMHDFIFIGGSSYVVADLLTFLKQ